MAVISGNTGIVFAGYLDDAEEMLTGGKRRALFLCDNNTAAGNLPSIGDRFALGTSGATAAIAAGSIAIVRGVGRLTLGTDDVWGAI